MRNGDAMEVRGRGAARRKWVRDVVVARRLNLRWQLLSDAGDGPPTPHPRRPPERGDAMAGGDPMAGMAPMSCGDPEVERFGGGISLGCR